MVFDAATRGDLAELETALDQAPDQARAYGPDGWTALHLAAHYGHADAVRVLLERGAAVDAVSRNAMANQALHAALAGREDAATVRLLLDAGSDVNGAAATGVTPLHLSAARGNAELARLLIDRGADPRARMDDGQRPADLARARGHPAVADQLEREQRAATNE
jgi:ankyrin repeat protein